jgi:CheY-like chemotaxis protein
VYIKNPKTSNSLNKETRKFVDLRIEVSDTGIGIPKEMLEEVFKPFIQGQDQNVKKYGGTGLGLAITKRLLQLMNATIDLDSRLNKGSTFKIKIPEVAYLNEFDKSADEILLDPSKIIFEEALILIADDVEHNRSYLRDALKKTNLKIVEAENGQEALSIAKKILPDLIISDIRMPILDGFELLNKLKSDKAIKHIPVIAYSASVMKDQKDRIFESKFSGLLIKPVLVTELYFELMKHLKYEMLKVSDSDQPVPEINLNPNISDLPGLIHSLDNYFKGVSETFEIIQPIDKIRAFGNELVILGINHNSVAITNYGEELVRSADSFNIEEIMKLIRKYKSMVESLKELTENTENDQ